MKLDKNNAVKKAFFIAVAVLILFIAALMQASSEEIEKVKYTDLEKEELSDDYESQDLLKEYYGDLLGYVKKEDIKFNTIATKDSLAILNVTINGKDRRIFTRLNTGTLYPAQSLADTITTTNLVVLGNISLKGNLFFDAEKSFGLRRFYGIGSTTSKYIDEGFARLANGKANVSVNPVLRELISSYNVFLSAEGLTKGIYVAEKTNSYFVVKSVNAKSNVGFSWMLSGVKQDFNEKLGSEYGKEKSIGITAEIDFEAGTTEIKINGLNRIFELINKTLGQVSNNALINETSGNITNQSMILITGNLVDEFGLETDLGRILGERAILPNLSETAETPLNNITGESITPVTAENITPVETAPDIGLGNATSNETTAGLNETIRSSVLEFTLYSTNEDFIISQVADVTGLSLSQAKKLINFVYFEPVNFEDETIEALQPPLDFIEKVNGSVIIRLG